VSGDECVARGQDRESASFLYVPTCSCPECAPEGPPPPPVAVERAWISERRHRPRVAGRELGPTGRGMLG
jgi:hypothetical protein